MAAAQTATASTSSAASGSATPLVQPQAPAVAAYSAITKSTLVPKPPAKVVLLKPTSADQTPDALKAKLLASAPTSSRPIKVKFMAVTKKGSLRIELTSDLETGSLQDPALLKQIGASVVTPSPPSLFMLVHNIPATVPTEDLTSIIVNLLPANCSQKELTLSKEIKSKSPDARHLLYRMSADILRHFLAEGRIYHGFHSFRLNQFFELLRRFNSQAVGHGSSRCPKKSPVFGHCAESGHNFRQCASRFSKPICALCKSINKPADHDCRS